MGRRSSDAAVKDVKIKLRKEECARGMAHSLNHANDAAVKDVKIKLRPEECV